MKVKDLQFEKKDIIAIPNILTYIRLAFVPLFAVVFANAHTAADHIWSVVIILAAGGTDILDGIIARKFNMITYLGKILDPIADKLMTACMMICLMIKYHVVIALFALYAVKEIILVIFSTWLLSKGKHIDGALWCGKLCTVVLYLIILALVCIPEISKGVEIMLCGIAAFFILLSFFVYMNVYMGLYREYKRELDAPRRIGAGN